MDRGGGWEGGGRLCLPIGLFGVEVLVIGQDKTVGP